MRALWEHFGCPKTDLASSTQRAAFLGCLPSIVGIPSIPHQGILRVGDIQYKYQDWLPHVTHEETKDLDSILKVCEDYEEERTFYSEAEANRWTEYWERILTASNTKKPTRRQMTISWLRPLMGLSSGDYQLLCSRAALGRGATRQQVYFHGYGRAQPHMTTMQDNAQRLKQRYAVRNALRYLNIKSNIIAWSWKEFMEYSLTPALANKHTVKFFVQQCCVEFTKRWCQPL